MELRQSDDAISEVCREVERRMRGSDEVHSLLLPVAVLDNFVALFHDDPTKRASPAAYDPAIQQILINRTPFFGLDSDAAQATLAHEIGHAVVIRDSLMGTLYRAFDVDCPVADRLACKWGFLAGLKKVRMASYEGDRLCAALDRWENEEEYVRCLEAYRQHVLNRRIAGY